MKCRIIHIILMLTCLSSVIQAQENEQNTFKDTLDGKLDVSHFLVDMHGFIPLVQLVTEPALGSIGVVVAPVFITPNKHKVEGKYIPPDITTVFGGYTANQTWMTGALRIATLPKYGLKYRVGFGYASVNLDFYRDIPVKGETKFPFNFKTAPIFGSLTKEIGNTNIYAGVEYLFMKTEVTPEFGGTLPDFIEDKSLETVQSSPGVVVEYDGRNSVFTPDKGTFVSANFRVNANWTGSDFEYENLKVYMLQYFQTTSQWVSGFRLETQQQFGNAPFYLEPGLNMRGVPAAKYQGTSTYLLETEQRYDFNLRWSGVAFGGGAKAFNDNKTFGEADWVYNYGVGFRYLIARLFNLRMGVDVAWSNNDFGYYIVFGSAWR